MGKYIIRCTGTGFLFTLKAANGEAIATSEVYDTLAACRKGIESVKKCALSARLEDRTGQNAKVLPNPKFELFTDKTGAFRFRLKARNGKIIAVSDGYASRAGCEKGIESVRANAIAETETEV